MFNFYGLSDKGDKMSFQQDSFYGFERNNTLFLMLADGGGSKEGLDVASLIAINQIVNYIEKFFPITNNIVNISFLKKLIDGAIYSANREIMAYKKANAELYGGIFSTLTICVITSNKDIIIAHVGDSRLYLLRNGNIAQLTKDHTEAQILLEQKKIVKEEIRIHQSRHILTKCLGVVSDLKYDFMLGKLDKGDVLLLCSNGLYDLMFDDEIKNILLEVTETKTACEWLIKGANQRGGFDNISTLISYINF